MRLGSYAHFEGLAQCELCEIDYWNPYYGRSNCTSCPIGGLCEQRGMLICCFGLLIVLICLSVCLFVGTTRPISAPGFYESVDVAFAFVQCIPAGMYYTLTYACYIVDCRVLLY